MHRFKRAKNTSEHDVLVLNERFVVNEFNLIKYNVDFHVATF